MAHNNGGKKPGAGRKKGVPNKNTVFAQLRDKLLKNGQTPLEFLVELYRSPMPKIKPNEDVGIYLKRLELWDRNRVIGAKEAAPYLHSKLSSVEVTGKDGGDIAHKHQILIEFVEGKR